MFLLVIDDESDMEVLFQQVFRSDIKEGNINLRFAGSGQEGLDILIKELNPQDEGAVIVDFCLPDINGLEILRECKNKFPYVRVFITTGITDNGTADSCLTQGADGFIPKPIDFKKLKSLLLGEKG